MLRRVRWLIWSCMMHLGFSGFQISRSFIVLFPSLFVGLNFFPLHSERYSSSPQRDRQVRLSAFLSRRISSSRTYLSLRSSLKLQGLLRMSTEPLRPCKCCSVACGTWADPVCARVSTGSTSGFTLGATFTYGEDLRKSFVTTRDFPTRFRLAARLKMLLMAFQTKI